MLTACVQVEVGPIPATHSQALFNTSPSHCTTAFTLNMTFFISAQTIPLKKMLILSTDSEKLSASTDWSLHHGRDAGACFLTSYLSINNVLLNFGLRNFGYCLTMGCYHHPECWCMGEVGRGCEGEERPSFGWQSPCYGCIPPIDRWLQLFGLSHGSVTHDILVRAALRSLTFWQIAVRRLLLHAIAQWRNLCTSNTSSKSAI